MIRAVPFYERGSYWEQRQADLRDDIHITEHRLLQAEGRLRDAMATLSQSRLAEGRNHSHRTHRLLGFAARVLAEPSYTLPPP